jgi:hypothetical protein
MAKSLKCDPKAFLFPADLTKECEEKLNALNEFRAGASSHGLFLLGLPKMRITK